MEQSKAGFRPHLEGDVHACSLVDDLTQRFSPYLLGARRRPSTDFIEKCQECLKQVVFNLIALSFSPDRGVLAIPAGKNWFVDEKIMLGEKISHAAMQKALDWLALEHLATVRAGRQSRVEQYRRVRTTAATSMLLELFQRYSVSHASVWSSRSFDLLRLKSSRDSEGNRHRLSFGPTQETERMATNLLRINEDLAFANLNLDLKEGQLAEMVQAVRERRRTHGIESSVLNALAFDRSQCTLYRVFNNGSFEQGGRFYGGWWQNIPSRFRPFITINGEPTIEADYSAMHPTILYHQAGLEMPEDPYVLPFGPRFRHVAKRIFNALINAGSVSIDRVEGFDERAMGMTWQQCLGLAKQAFQPVRRYFGTGYGLRLQRMDSDIAEAVMLHFVARGIPILPVHDSFICAQRRQAELVAVMEREFKKRVGCSVGIKIENAGTPTQVTA